MLCYLVLEGGVLLCYLVLDVGVLYCTVYYYITQMCDTYYTVYYYITQVIDTVLYGITTLLYYSGKDAQVGGVGSRVPQVNILKSLFSSDFMLKRYEGTDICDFFCILLIDMISYVTCTLIDMVSYVTYTLIDMVSHVHS